MDNAKRQLHAEETKKSRVLLSSVAVVEFHVVAGELVRCDERLVLVLTLGFLTREVVAAEETLLPKSLAGLVLLAAEPFPPAELLLSLVVEDSMLLDPVVEEPAPIP